MLKFKDGWDLILIAISNIDQILLLGYSIQANFSIIFFPALGRKGCFGHDSIT